MVSKAGKTSQFQPISTVRIVTALCLLMLAAVLAGCTVGPVEIGGPDATPTSTNTPLPTPIPPTPTTPPRPVSGMITDAYSGKPVAGANVNAGSLLVQSGADGTYTFKDVPKGTKVQVSATGYASTEMDPGDSTQLAVQLRPTTLSGRVTDATTGKPLANVLVKLVLPAGTSATAGATGTVTSTGGFTNPMEATMIAQPTLSMPNGTPATTPTTAAGSLPGMAAPLQQSDAATATTDTSDDTGTTGTDSQASGTPASTNTALPPTATPTPKLVPPTGDGFVAVFTDANGNYSFKDVPQGASLTFKIPGYKLTKMDIGKTASMDVALPQFQVHAMYITANVAASPDLYKPLIDFLQKSTFNAVVLNVQDDSSAWAYDTQNPLVLAAKDTDLLLPNIKDLLADLRSKGIYSIARVVTFQQAALADSRPDLAVMSSVTGKPWKGGYAGQQRWLDASNPKAQDYMLDMTKEVLGLGFDEIQYDYIRFPSDPAPNEPGDMVFSKPLDDSTKPLEIEGFLKRAHALVEPTDSFMSIDIFGYTIWPDQEGKPLNGVIGQVFEHIVDNTDYVAPMIYPSHFSPGELGCAHPETCAYQIIKQAGIYAEQRFAGHVAKYRPWLQDFDWGTTDYTSPGTTKVTDQMKACSETGCWGWMMWDPYNQYEPRAAFKK